MTSQTLTILRLGTRGRRVSGTWIALMALAALGLAAICVADIPRLIASCLAAYIGLLA
jgi:hypothetical protein